MSGQLYLPGHTADEFLALDQAQGMQGIQVARAFEALARQLEDRIRVVWFKHDATSVENPGRWHIAVLGPGERALELFQLFVVQNPDGSYCEPDERHYQALLSRDGFGRAGGAYAKMVKARTERQRARLRAHEETRRIFREALEDRISHIHDRRIAVSGAMKARSGGTSVLGPDGKPLVTDADKPREEARKVPQLAEMVRAASGDALRPAPSVARETVAANPLEHYEPA